jgi:hypothetical protein
MPAAKDAISTLVDALASAPTLIGYARVLSGSRHMSRVNSAPPRVVIFPTEGDVRAARDASDGERDMDVALVAHLWGKDFPQALELVARFLQAMDYQASPQPSSSSNPAGAFWKTGACKWDTTEDSTKQGEELYLILTSPIQLPKVAPTLGQVLATSLNTTSTTLTSSMGSSDTSAAVASTAGFPSQGYFTVDAEQIRYTGLTATSITGLVRGSNGTTPATHSNGATVAPLQHP